MARITLSGLVSDIRGKLNGSVFKQGNAGLVLQNKPAGGGQRARVIGSPKNLQSVLGPNATLANQIVKNRWDGLTDEQRQLWEAIVQAQPKKQKNNSSLFINSLQYFTQVNVIRTMLGNNAIIAPLAGAENPEPLSIDDITATANLTIAFNRPITTDEIVLLNLSAPVRSTVNTVGSRLRLFPAVVVSPFINTIVKLDYQAAFGFIPIPGQQIFASISVQNDLSGLRSIVSEAKFILL